MPPKKNKLTNKSPWKKSAVEEYAKDAATVRKAMETHTDHVKSTKREVKKRRLEPLKQMVQDAEFSTILKEPGNDLQEDVVDESFNPPLHSTAVYSDDDFLPERNKECKEKSPKMPPPASAVRRRKANVSVKQTRTLSKKKKTVSFRENSSTEPDAPVQKTRQPQKPEEEGQQMSSTQSLSPKPTPRKTPKKARQPFHETQSYENNASSEVATEEEKQQITMPGPAPNKIPQKPTSVQELESSENIDSQDIATEEKQQMSSTQSPSPEPAPNKMPQKPTSVQEVQSFDNIVSQDVSAEEEQHMSSSQTPSPEPAPNKKSAGKSKYADKKSTPSKKPKKKIGQKNKVPLKIWSPEDRPRTARDLNELDDVLHDFETLVEEYRESVDTEVGRKAVDRFSLSFKELLTSSIKDLQMLKDLKRKNPKVHQENGVKRKRLMEVKDEIMKKLPRLNQLQKECSALEEKQESLKKANTFLEKLQQLQADCREYKERHSHAKDVPVTYGMSSLPALLIEAQSHMRAEQHFHYVNTKLQSMMDKQTETG